MCCTPRSVKQVLAFCMPPPCLGEQCHSDCDYASKCSMPGIFLLLASQSQFPTPSSGGRVGPAGRVSKCGPLPTLVHPLGGSRRGGGQRPWVGASERARAWRAHGQARCCVWGVQFPWPARRALCGLAARVGPAGRVSKCGPLPTLVDPLGGLRGGGLRVPVGSR